MDSQSGEEIKKGIAEKADAYERALVSLEAFYEDRIAALEQRISYLEERVGALGGAQYYIDGTTVFPAIEPIYDSVDGGTTDSSSTTAPPRAPESPPAGNKGANEIILELLGQGAMTSGELRDNTNMNLSVITKGLRELRMEKKIRSKKDGSVIRYFI